MANSASRFAHAADGTALADIGSGTVTSLSNSNGSVITQYALGQEAVRDAVLYRLVYNAGNSAIPPGMIAGQLAGNGVNSVTVSTASSTWAEFGAVVNNSAASVVTGAYFWGAKRGVLASGMVASAVCIPSGSPFYVGTNGNIVLFPQSVVTGANACGYAITTVLSTTSGGGRNGSVIIELP
jgi:hypothetical protein